MPTSKCEAVAALRRKSFTRSRVSLLEARVAIIPVGGDNWGVNSSAEVDTVDWEEYMTRRLTDPRRDVGCIARTIDQVDIFEVIRLETVF
jgi:hypothetical protein